MTAVLTDELRAAWADITRREFVFGVAAAAALVAAGCGGDDDDQGATPSSGKQTRQFVDVTGKAIEVPNVAKRIVATNDQNAGAQLLSLGAPVVGIVRDGVIDPSIADYFDVEGIRLVGEHFAPNIEVIASLDPDLIVHEGFDGATSLEADAFTSLSALAPVVSIDTFRPVGEFMPEFAELLGGGAIGRLDQQAAELQARTEELTAVLGAGWKDVTASFVITNGEALEAWGPSTLGATNLLTEAGASWVPLMLEADLPKNGGYIAAISEERIPEFSADLVLVDTSSGGDAVLRHPLFVALPAAKAGQVIEFDSSRLTDTHYPGVIAIAEFLIEQVAKLDVQTDLV